VWFAVEVPDADFYQGEVGKRGSLTFSRDELTEKEWKVALSLGP